MNIEKELEKFKKEHAKVTARFIAKFNKVYEQAVTKASNATMAIDKIMEVRNEAHDEMVEATEALSQIKSTEV